MGIYSDSGSNLPSMQDLLFLGTIPPSIKEVATKRRPGTGTVVLQFEATSGEYKKQLQLNSATDTECMWVNFHHFSI